MAIRFNCQRCGQLLSIARRKAGTRIECPECGDSLVVPSEEAAAVSMAMHKIARRQGPRENASNVVVFDADSTSDHAPSQSSPASRQPPRDTIGATDATGTTDTSVGQADPALFRTTIVYRRHTLYVQAMLFLALGLAALVAGYFMGRGDASFELEQAHRAAAREAVLVDGKVVHDPGTGTLEGDEGAVLIVLPDGPFPEETLSIHGIRPHDPAPDDRHESVQRIKAFGGVYARADASGAFTFVLSEEGKYRLLIISASADRPEEDELDELDRDEIRRYFYLASDLIDQHKYRWSLETFRVGGDPVIHNFGRDGQADP